MPEGTTPRERNIMPKVGARFFLEDGEVTFEFVVDPNNIIGPRPATRADSEKHPEAWLGFATGEPEGAEIDVVPDARDEEPPADPLSAVAPKDMDKFEARLAPAPAKPKRAPVKRRATKRKAA